MKKIFIVALFAATCLFCGRANAQSPEYTEAMKTYMSVSGSGATFSTTVDMLIAQIGLTQEQQEIAKNELKDKAIDMLYDLLIPAYEANVTLEDLQAAIDFYKTPAGERLATATPKLLAASQTISQQWVMEFYQMVTAKFSN